MKNPKVISRLVYFFISVAVILVACQNLPQSATDSKNNTTNSALKNSPVTNLANASPAAKPASEEDVVLGPGKNAKLPPSTVSPDNDTRAVTILKEKPTKGKIKAPFKDQDFPVTISEYEFSGDFDDDKDGAEDEKGNGFVDIQGLGKHQVELDQDNFPIMDSRKDKLTVTDKSTGNKRIFTADQDLFNYTISDGSNSLQIKTNPDGSWTVNDEEAATPEAVVKLALKSPVLADASVHGLASMYTLFNNGTKIPMILEPATLTVVDCGGNGGTQAAPDIGDPRPLIKAALNHFISSSP